jgi:RNA polymerase sigma factor (sigma-70 family)
VRKELSMADRTIEAGARTSSSSEAAAAMLCDELREVVRSAVASVVRERRLDLEALVAEVESDLAERLLTGRFSGHDAARASFKTYLAAAARNRAIDLLGRGRRRSVSLDDLIERGDFAPASSSGRDDPCEAAIENEERFLLLEALRDLAEDDPKGAYLLEALYLEGLSYDELAQRLGAAKVSDLHLRAHRARQALRRLVPCLETTG